MILTLPSTSIIYAITKAQKGNEVPATKEKNDPNILQHLSGLLS
jgi:hypothetical protein